MGEINGPKRVSSFLENFEGNGMNAEVVVEENPEVNYSENDEQ